MSQQLSHLSPAKEDSLHRPQSSSSAKKGKAVSFGTVTTASSTSIINASLAFLKDATIVSSKQAIDQSDVNMQLDVPDLNANLQSSSMVPVNSEVNNQKLEMEIWNDDLTQFENLCTHINKSYLYATGLTILSIDNLQSN
ncbi:hypothetical protein RclHR1_08560003 [Rhizophagus clarus]|uniref:Uncharacterized protein n=1 Tax=Rhizophagus clarus TaxID=94130 RepID=A0A2Z6SND9_9GLOM|nr:hypothetical protein RclHR1_08560003 [Rhizophagus clarus]GES85471.1 hypothetical protein RCL_jg6487.t1 [Rhizophagus clarus]